MATRLIQAEFKTGTAQAADGDVDKTLIAAQGANKVIRILSGYVQVNVAAVGDGGEVALEDGAGGTKFFRADADAVGHYNFFFAPPGYPLTANTLLNLTVDGAGTTQATATATVVADIAE